MTQDEYLDWFRHHLAAFPGLGGWLAKVTSAAEDGMKPTRKQIMERWYRALERIPLAKAKAATDAMLAGDLDEPRSFDRHPAAIRAWANGHADRAVKSRHVAPDGRETFACLDCLDTGLVTVWHSTAIQAARKGTLGEPRTLYTCAMPCRCKGGDLFAKVLPKSGRFNPERVVAVRRFTPLRDQVEELAERVAIMDSEAVKAKSNYCPEFD
jgi:hypothetical protein